MIVIARALVAAAVLAVAFVPSALAQTWSPSVSGNNIYQACSTPEGNTQLGCSSYVLGIADLLSAMPVGLSKACIPQNADEPQLADVVMKYLILHPEYRNLNGAALVWAAFANAFPC